MSNVVLSCNYVSLSLSCVKKVSLEILKQKMVQFTFISRTKQTIKLLFVKHK